MPTNALRPKTTSTTFFHCAPVLLAPGSIIEPGNWGRIIRTYRCVPQQAYSPVAFREAIFEAVRKRVAPDKPSRLACVFACPSQHELGAFMATGRTVDVPYEVAPVDDPPLHFGGHDLPLLTVGQNEPYFDVFEPRALEYWTGPPPPQRIEVLIGGPVRVVRRL